MWKFYRVQITCFKQNVRTSSANLIFEWIMLKYQIFNFKNQLNFCNIESIFYRMFYLQHLHLLHHSVHQALTDNTLTAKHLLHLHVSLFFFIRKNLIITVSSFSLFFFLILTIFHYVSLCTVETKRKISMSISLFQYVNTKNCLCVHKFSVKFFVSLVL